MDFVTKRILEVRGTDRSGQAFRFRTEDPMTPPEAAYLGLKRAGFNPDYFTTDFPQSLELGHATTYGYTDKRTYQRVPCGSVHEVL